MEVFYDCFATYTSSVTYGDSFPSRGSLWGGTNTKKNTILTDGVLFGAGYGNRTRLCGLGSDHSTDELTLRMAVL